MGISDGRHLRTDAAPSPPRMPAAALPHLAIAHARINGPARRQSDSVKPSQSQPPGADHLTVLNNAVPPDVLLRGGQIQALLLRCYPTLCKNLLRWISTTISLLRGTQRLQPLFQWYNHPCNPNAPVRPDFPGLLTFSSDTYLRDRVCSIVLKCKFRKNLLPQFWSHL